MFIYGNKKFTNPIEIITAFDDVEFIKAISKIQKLQEKHFLTGYISYQAKEVFLNHKIISKTPLLYFEVHNDFENFEIEKPFKKADLYLKENITFKKYASAIKKIKNHILNGATYEVNYTYSNDIMTPNTAWELFLNLIQNQKTPYCAYIKNEFNEILSFSPELFFEIKNNKITTKPMKGTVKRKGDDKKEIAFLKNDIKNLAENTMIVDLIRNDLSKIKDGFNIKTEKLFEVETHKTLHQMTSTITAGLKSFNLYDILSSLFPCGSITGAPKISTMEIIDSVENYKRNIYCGLIGIIHKNEVNFSVPIRILEKTKNENKFTFCQGGAIVNKSTIKDEWEECIVKRAFLNPNLEFNLIETMYNSNHIKDYYFHLKRLKNACKFFGYKFNHHLLNENFENNKIVRIVLSKNGEYEIQYRNLDEIKENKIKISKEKTYSKNPFLYYKTDFRPWYDKNLDGLFDLIFLNEKNELTEGTRTNIILKIDNELFTPKINSGLLNGILRQKFLKRGKIKEKTLYFDDILKCEKIYLINSIRNIREVKL